MAARGATAAIPIAAICCLGLILLGIAATIILALIPVYLSQKSATLGAINSKQKSLSYSVPVSSSTPSATLSSSQNSAVTSLLDGALTTSVSSSGGVSVSGGTVSAGRRRKRQNTGQILFLIVLIYGRTTGILNIIEALLNAFIIAQQSAISSLVLSLLTSTTSAATAAVSATASSAVSTAASGRRRRNIFLRGQHQQAALEASNAYND